MSSLRWIGGLVSLAFVGAGCGSVKNGGTDAAGGGADAPVATPDAPAGTPDAPAGTPDAATCTTAPTCANGMVTCAGTVIETCALGCFDSTRCAEVGTSNGLDAVLDDAAGKGDVTLPSGTTIDSDAGTVSGTGGAILVDTTLVSQSGGPNLRVFYARSFSMSNIRITGTLPVAFVSSGDVTLIGLIDASADDKVPGPGGSASCAAAADGSTPTTGFWARPRAGDTGAGAYVWNSGGSGGGGFGSAGAAGGAYVSGSTTFPAGAPGGIDGAVKLVPLRGGCPGGDNTVGGVSTGLAGAGGGAVQIVSGGTILVDGSSAPAGVHVGGGGGTCASPGGALNDANQYDAAGGGSGGGVLLEAVDVRFQGAARLLAGGGGGGGSGGCGSAGFGRDATPDGTVAAGGACPAESWGTPTPGGAGAASGPAAPGLDTNYISGGGGGGGAGRIRINTGTGAYTGTPGVLVGVVSQGDVAKR